MIAAKPLYLVAAVLLYFLVQGLSAYRWQLVLKPQGIEIPFSRVLAYYFLGMYFNFFLPSSIGGDVAKIYYLNKETRKLSASTASVFFDRDIGMGGLVLIALVTAMFANPEHMRVNGVPLVPIFALIGAAFVAANLALFYRRTYNLLHRMLSMFKMKRVDDRIERMYSSVNVYRNRWDLVVITMLISFAVQAGCALVNLAAGKAIGLDKVGFADYMVFIPAIGLISMFPISLGGAGVREGGYILVFASIGVDKHQALALSLLWLGVVAITSLPGGIVYLTRGSHKDEHIPPDVETMEEEEEKSLHGAMARGGDSDLQALPEAPKETAPSL